MGSCCFTAGSNSWRVAPSRPARRPGTFCDARLFERRFWAKVQGLGELVTSETYLIVNPCGAGTAKGAPAGIDVYTRAAEQLLREQRRVETLVNLDRLAADAFRRVVRDHVIANFSSANVWVEAPESYASTLLIPPDYRVHVRLHCPRALAQFHDGRPIDRDALRDELHVIHHATCVSAPSRAMASEILAVGPLSNLLVYKNPPPLDPLASGPEKDIDVLFVGRFQRLKGIDFLASIIERLPRTCRVVLAGADADAFGRTCPGLLRRPQVEVQGSAPPAVVRALMRRARSVMIPSRFESFSMVGIEALAHHAVVVGWSEGAVRELAEPPLVLTAPAFNTADFARLVLTAIDLQPTISPAWFCDAVGRARKDFLEGIEAVHAPGRRAVSAAPAAAHRSTLLQIHEELNDMAAVSISKKGSFGRKLRKLQRDPRAFFRDSKLTSAAARLGLAREPKEKPAPNSTPKSEKKTEPRLFARMAWKGGKLNVTTYGRKVAVPSLATAVCVPREATLLVRRPILAEFLLDSGFLGFRDRYLFVIEFDPNEWPSPTTDPFQLVSAPSDLRKSPFAEIRNFIFVDHDGPLPAALRATHRNSRLVCIVTDPSLIMPEHSADIDVLLAPAAFNPPSSWTVHRTIVSDTLPGAVDALKQVIIDHTSKEKNMFVPVYGEVQKLAGMSELLASRAEGLIILRDQGVIHGARTFHDIVTVLAQNATGILLREEQYIRYRQYCQAADPTRLLEVSFADGCRYEFLS